MSGQIRRYRASDESAAVELSLRAWAPVFASLERELGSELFTRLHGDWREYQAQAVRDALAVEGMHARVVLADERVAGFAVALWYFKAL